MRRRARGKILKQMMPQNQSRMLETHPHSRHPRIAIRVHEIHVATNKNVAVIRAPRRQDQGGKQNDFKNRDNGPSHGTVLIENPKWQGLACQAVVFWRIAFTVGRQIRSSKREYRNSKQIRMSKISKFQNLGHFRVSKLSRISS